MTTVVKCSVLCSLVITSDSMESPPIEAHGTACNEDKHILRSATCEHLTCASHTAIFLSLLHTHREEIPSK